MGDTIAYVVCSSIINLGKHTIHDHVVTGTILTLIGLALLLAWLLDHFHDFNTPPTSSTALAIVPMHIFGLVAYACIVPHLAFCVATLVHTLLPLHPDYTVAGMATALQPIIALPVFVVCSIAGDYTIHGYWAYLENVAFLIDAKEFLKTRAADAQRLTYTLWRRSVIWSSKELLDVYSKALRKCVANDWPGTRYGVYEGTLTAAGLHAPSQCMPLFPTCAPSPHTSPFSQTIIKRHLFRMFPDRPDPVKPAPIVDVALASRRMAIELVVAMISHSEQNDPDLLQCVDTMMDARDALPIQLFRSRFSKGIKAGEQFDAWIAEQMQHLRTLPDNVVQQRYPLNLFARSDKSVSNNDQMAQQFCRSLVLSGVERLAAAITCLFIELQDNPELLEKLRGGGGGGGGSSSARNSVLEVLRRNPPSAVVVKQCHELAWPKRYALPRHVAHVVINLLSVQTDPTQSVFGENADRFDPDRPGLTEKSIYSFGVGDYVCPMRDWCLDQLETLLVELAFTGEWKLVRDPFLYHGQVMTFPEGVLCYMNRYPGSKPPSQ